MNKRSLTFLDFVHPFLSFTYFFFNFLPTSVSSYFLKFFILWQVFNFSLFHTPAHTLLSFTRQLLTCCRYCRSPGSFVLSPIPNILDVGSSQKCESGPVGFSRTAQMAAAGSTLPAVTMQLLVDCVIVVAVH